MRLTLAQVMKFVTYAAVACGCAAPFVGVVPLGSLGIVTLVGVCATFIPLAWACLSFVLIKRGAVRDIVILGCLLCASVAMMLHLTYATLMLLGGMRKLDLRTALHAPFSMWLMSLAGLMLLFATAAVFLIVAIVGHARGLRRTRSLFDPVRKGA